MKYKKCRKNNCFKNICCYDKNCCIYSDEPYEFRFTGGTPDGRIIVPNSKIYAPYDVKKIILKKNSVSIKSSKIESISTITRGNNKYIEVIIKYKVSFCIKIYNRYNHLYKTRCYIDKYPMPNNQSFIKDFIRVYSIATSRILINCGNSDICKNSSYPKVTLYDKACIKNINCKYCKEKKYISFYDVNCEEYIMIRVGILILGKMKVVFNKDIC
ncbi:hypothetical protein [Clostridium beijerinckii]|uniref:hypothetical protein n=1 Tax=Clostridium beijerinckii TaxID=1520 RepID=UPI000479899E|nr:hypothetical protein [Clostridium beijerinckii]